MSGDDDDSTPANLIATGISMGIIHVLTGPDHLTAIASITAGVHYKSAFCSGIGWGLGHSTGLFIVTIIFLAIDLNIDDLDHVGHYCEWIVGFLM